jgi:hypothetical protein
MLKVSRDDTKSSLPSFEHSNCKIVFDLCESSRIVEHLEESQEELEFLKGKLSEAYQKL